MVLRNILQTRRLEGCKLFYNLFNNNSFWKFFYNLFNNNSFWQISFSCKFSLCFSQYLSNGFILGRDFMGFTQVSDGSLKVPQSSVRLTPPVVRLDDDIARIITT